MEKRRGLVVLGIVAALVLVGSFRYAASRRLAANPLQGVAIESAHLLEQAKRLQDNLQKTEPTLAHINEYLQTMRALQHACSRIDTYQTRGSGLTPDQKTRLDNAIKLCADLSKLGADSEHVYASLSLLLTVNTRSRRWQTLPPLAGWARHRHIALAAKAVNEVTKQSFAGLDFPTELPGRLTQLQKDIAGNKGLDYLRQLRSFQLGAWGERVAYWNYADLPALQKTLQIQLRGLCQNLDTNSSVKECASHSPAAGARRSG
jgi:hypothetical protein